MEKYLGLFLMKLKGIFQYRVTIFTRLPVQVIRAMLSITIYIAFFMSSSSNDYENLKEVISYIWLQNSFMPFITYWMIDSELNDSIRLGNVSYELVRPLDLYWNWFIKLISQRIGLGILCCMPIILISLIAPGFYKLTLNITLVKLILFLVSIILALILNTLMSLIIYISVFKTFTITGSLLFFGTIGEFAGGLLIPLMIMPENVQHILDYLPFRFGGDFPFRILINNYSLDDVVTGLALQIIWILIMIVIGQKWLKSNLTKVVIQGG